MILSAKIRFFCFFAFLLSVSIISSRAEVLPVKTYTTNDGLLRDTASCIKRDSRGFLWFCTSDGLSRFDGYGFTNYTTDEGLPHRNVTDFLETRDGIYWVATLDGLVRFNLQGKRGETMFTVFKPADNPQAKEIYTLFEDSRGVLWCGTANGLYRIQNKDNQIVFERIDLPKDRSDIPLSVSAMIEDKKGNLLVGMDGGQGLNRISPNGAVEHFSAKRGQKTNESIKTMFKTSSGEIWVGMSIDGGVCSLVSELNPQASIFSRCLTKKDGLPSNWVNSLFQTSDAKLWIGTTDGAVSFENDSELRVYKEAQGLCDKGFYAFQEDRDGNLWVSTNCGIKKISRSGFVRYTQSDGLTALQVNGIFTSRNGELFVITKRTVETSNKTNIETHQINRFENDKFTAVEPKLPPNISSGWGGGQIVVEDKIGDWWLPSGNHAVFHFNAGNFQQFANTKPLVISISDETVFRLYEDLHSDIWISTMGSGHLLRWERATQMLLDDTSKISFGNGQPYANYFAEDKQGTLWISSEYSDDLIRAKDGNFSILKTNPEKTGGNVNSLYFDSIGRLWLTTTLNGVGRIDNPNADMLEIVWYKRKNGLATDGARGLVEDNFGRIYAVNGRGIDRITPNSGQIKHYTTADGLPQGLNYNAVRDAQGNLWFGGSQGLARLIPEQDKPRQAPNILLTGLRVEGARQAVSELGETDLPQLKLDSNQTHVSIDFLGLGASLGEELKYQYKLEGASDDWIETTQRTVDFANLAAGSYHFTVRAITFDGIISQTPATVSFTIAAPIWKRWWFLLLATILVCGLIYLLYRYRVAELLRVERVRTRIATDLHDDIGSNLSKISVLSEVARLQMTKGNEENNRLLASIAEIARESVGSMSDIVWTINPKRDSVLEMTRKMREHAEETFVPKNVSVKFNVPVDGENAKLPMDLRREIYLIFKEAVTNAAKHSNCKQVKIDFRCQGREIFLQVKDDGKGFDTDAETNGNGLENMKSRAENFGGKLEIESDEKSGTAVRLKVLNN